MALSTVREIQPVSAIGAASVSRKGRSPPTWGVSSTSASTEAVAGGGGIPPPWVHENEPNDGLRPGQDAVIVEGSGCRRHGRPICRSLASASSRWVRNGGDTFSPSAAAARSPPVHRSGPTRRDGRHRLGSPRERQGS